MTTDFVFYYHPHCEFETQPDAQLGLGLLSLATYAKELGADVRVINAQADKVSEGIQRIPVCNCLMLYGCLIDKSIIHLITMVSGVKSVIVGGPITKSYNNIGHINVDGPGEDVIEGYTNRKTLFGRFTHVPKLKKDINEYPFPDRSLIEGPKGSSIFKHRESEQSTTILTSRGCKFKCAFCTDGQNTFQQDYNMDRIEKELESCLSLGIKDIRISDDNLIQNEERLTMLCNMFREGGINWRASIRTHPNDLSMYEYMVQSGCRELSFGIESGDQEVLNLLNKGTTVKQNTKAIQNANKAGVTTTRALIMMGTPGETKETAERNVDWILDAQPKSVSLKMFVPYPGTDIYENPDKYDCKINLMDPNNSAYRPDGSLAYANISLPNMSQEELTIQFHAVKKVVENWGIENRG